MDKNTATEEDSDKDEYFNKFLRFIIYTMGRKVYGLCLPSYKN